MRMSFVDNHSVLFVNSTEEMHGKVKLDGNSSLLHTKKTKQNPVTTINHIEHKHHYIQYNIQQYHERRSISAHTTKFNI